MILKIHVLTIYDQRTFDTFFNCAFFIAAASPPALTELTELELLLLGRGGGAGGPTPPGGGGGPGGIGTLDEGGGPGGAGGGPV